MLKIGIMGGTFNPVHYGHLIAAQEALSCFSLDFVFFIPNGTPPHKKSPEKSGSSLHRFKMVELAVASNPFFKVSSVEIDRSGPSYAVDTVGELKKNAPDDKFFFITGIDAFVNYDWYGFETLLERLESFIAVGRPGFDLDAFYAKRSRVENADKIHYLPIPGFEVSSTDIRFRLQQGHSVKYMLPDEVLDYIFVNRLYGSR